MRKVYLAFPLIFLLLLMGILSTGLQLTSQTTRNNFVIEKVAEYERRFRDSIVSDQGELALISRDNRDNGQQYSIQLFDENFEKTWQYPIGGNSDLIYLDQDSIISVRNSWSGRDLHVSTRLTYVNRSLGLGDDIVAEFNMGDSIENNFGYFTLISEESVMVQNRLYCLYRYTVSADNNEYTLWGIMELDLQNRQTQQWVLGNSSASYNKFYLHQSDQQLEIKKIHKQVISPETTTVIVTTYQFDPTSGQLDDGIEEEYTCQVFCDPVVSDSDEFILVRYIEDNGRDEFEIQRGDQDLKVETDSYVDPFYGNPVGQNYLLIDLLYPSDQSVFSWFYLFNLETVQLLKFPKNPDNFNDWSYDILDDLISDSLINIVYDKEDQVSYFYRYNLKLKQTIDTVQQLGWGLPVVSLLLASGLGWIVMGALRSRNQSEESDLYPEIDN